MTTPGKENLTKFERRLHSVKGELVSQYDREKLAAETVDLDQTKIGRLSRMDALQQQNMAKSTMRNIESRMKRVSAALAKFAEGEYGYCESCGDDIALARLEVNPEAPCCFACQSQQEYHPQS
jgi:DnaK suppressor protein